MLNLFEPHRAHARAGATLAELLVAMLLAGVVLGSATSSLLRQQRTTGFVDHLTAANAQARSAAAIVAGEIAQLEVGQGDLESGEASDTSFQFRSVVATAVACVSGAGAITLTPDAAGLTGGATVSAPRAGDSLWWRPDSIWRGDRIEDAALASVTCESSPSIAGKGWRLVIGVADTIAAGTLLRTTRGARYGFYRSGDGTWQLGYREWSDATHHFAAPQPVAGPFTMRAGALRTGFRYYDSASVELPLVNGSVPASRVSRMRIVTLTVIPARRAGSDTIQTDSVDVALAHPA